MIAKQAIIAARKHIGGEMESSARYCLAEAVQRYDEGEFESAVMWAKRSMMYSVGIFHTEFIKLYS